MLPRGVSLTSAANIRRAMALYRNDLARLMVLRDAARRLHQSYLPDQPEGKRLYLECQRLIKRLRDRGAAGFAPAGRVNIVHGGQR